MNKFDALGQASWLWCNSILHSEWPVSGIAQYLIPPIERGQYEIITVEGLPVAYCTWAFFSKSAEAKYLLDPSSIDLSAWTSGDRLWFIDWVSPFSNAHTLALKNAMGRRFEGTLARALRVKPGRKVARVMEFKGATIEWPEARGLFEGYKRELLLTLGRSAIASSVKEENTIE